ncbi:MAG: choice-of-anchor Q domain-containing protein [Verrucomicrobiota bacterium]
MKSTLTRLQTHATALSLPALALALWILTTNALHAATGGPDGYGYTFKDSQEIDGPVFQWLDISSTGAVVISQGDDTSSTSGTNGIGAPVELGFPLTYHGATYDELVPTSNGYLSSDPSENGLDDTNDSTIPAKPDIGSGARFYVFHDDLTLNPANGKVYYEYLDISPHPHSDCGVSVFSWVNLRFVGGSALPLNFQVLIFDNGDILYQYDTSGLSFGTSVTVGLQNSAADDGLLYGANTAGFIFNNLAVLFEPPILTVTTETDEFDTPSGADLSLREAIRDISPGGKIEVASNVRNIDLAGGDPATMLLISNKTLSINGGGSDGQLCLTGNGAFRILQLLDANLVLENLCIQGGRSIIGGGGLYAPRNDDWLRLCNVEFLGHVSTSSGGALFANGNTRLSRCRFQKNLASLQGAAIFSSKPPENTGTGILVLDECEFSMNRSGSFGNAVSVSRFGEFRARRCAFFDNFRISNATGSSALYVTDSDTEVVNCTFSRNMDRALFVNNPTSISTRIAHNTFTDNCSAAFSAIVASGSATSEFHHNLFSGNSNSVLINVLDIDLSGNLFSDGHNVSDFPETELNHPDDFVVADPKLAPLGAYGGFTLSQIPLADSPIIDQGANPPPAPSPATDQRGLPRIANGDNSGSAVIDIGAAEAGPFITVTTNIDEFNGPASGAGASLREQLALTSPGQSIRFDPSLSGSQIAMASANFTFDTLGAGDIIHIDASNLAEPVTIDASAVNGIFSLNNGAVLSLHQLNLENPSANGVLDCFGESDATLDRCTVSGCSGHEAIFQLGGRIVLDQCAVRDNNGGGNAAMRISAGGWGRATRSLFERNSATSTGGGVSVVDAQFIAINSSFLENVASTGAGLNFQPGAGWHAESMTLWGCTFSSNRATNAGGGVFVQSDFGEIARCTVVSNIADDRGAGIASSSIGAGDIGLHHNIIAKNKLENAGSLDNIDSSGNTIFDSAGYNLTDSTEAEFDHPSDITATDPRLGPLTHHLGSPLRVHYPLSGSLAIDASALSDPDFLKRDNIGAPRLSSGDPSIPGTFTDIGAVEAAVPTVVTTMADEFDTPSGSNISLREAIRDASDGGRILFLDNLTDIFAQNFIDLGTAALGQGTSLTVEKSLIIDATNQPTGITLIGPAADRVFDLPTAGHDVSLHAISLTGGNAQPTGGGLRNIGCRLTLTQSAVYANDADTDGAGLIFNNGIGLLENVTISGNDADDQGGGIFAFAASDLTLRHCTVAFNESTAVAAGLHLAGGSVIRLYSTIIAENRRENGSIVNANTTAGVLSLGYNLTDGTFLSGTTDITSTAPDLAGLSAVGGFAFTHPLGSSSPAVNAGANEFTPGDPCTDARGFPRIVCGHIDIGAYELGGNLNGQPGFDSDGDGMDDFWEDFYGLNSSINDADLDFDGDGLTNLQEFLAQTKPNDATSRLRITEFFLTDGATENPDITWTSVPGLEYEIWISDDLGITDPWSFHSLSSTYTDINPSPFVIQQTLSDIDAATFQKLFLQIRASQ